MSNCQVLKSYIKKARVGRRLYDSALKGDKFTNRKQGGICKKGV